MEEIPIIDRGAQYDAWMSQMTAATDDQWRVATE